MNNDISTELSNRIKSSKPCNIREAILNPGSDEWYAAISVLIKDLDDSYVTLLSQYPETFVDIVTNVTFGNPDQEHWIELVKQFNELGY